MVKREISLSIGILTFVNVLNGDLAKQQERVKDVRAQPLVTLSFSTVHTRRMSLVPKFLP